MMKKVILGLAAMTMAVAMTANAGINVQYSVAFGLYPFGAPDVTSVDPGTGLLAANGTGSTLIQLIYAGANGVADGGVTSIATTIDDVVLQSRVISTSLGYDDWGFIGSVPSPFTNPVFTPGNVFVRVFQTETPVVGQYYYDTATLALEDRSLDIAFTQSLLIDSANAGIALNIPIVPEPSVMAFLGIGGLVLAARRRIRNA